MRKYLSGNSVQFDLVSKIWIFWLEIARARRLRATCGFHHSQAIVEEIPKSLRKRYKRFRPLLPVARKMAKGQHCSF